MQGNFIPQLGRTSSHNWRLHVEYRWEDITAYEISKASFTVLYRKLNGVNQMNENNLNWNRALGDGIQIKLEIASHSEIYEGNFSFTPEKNEHLDEITHRNIHHELFNLKYRNLTFDEKKPFESSNRVWNFQGDQNL